MQGTRDQVKLQDVWWKVKDGNINLKNQFQKDQ